MPKRTSSNPKENVPVKTVQSGPALRVQYPREGEAIMRPTYTFQIGALPEASGVEVAIDKGEWKPCRESLGLWWYDWSGYDKGEHVLMARTRVGKGVLAVSAPRRFSVS